MVTAQVQPPPGASVQVAVEKPTPASGPAIRWQVVVVPESRKQPAGRSSRAVPIVVVPSMYVPSALPVHDPLTLREPVISPLLQRGGSRPANEMSSFPPSARQDEVTFHVPTTLPPQAVTLGQV